MTAVTKDQSPVRLSPERRATLADVLKHASLASIPSKDDVLTKPSPYTRAASSVASLPSPKMDLGRMPTMKFLKAVDNKARSVQPVSDNRGSRQKLFEGADFIKTMGLGKKFVEFVEVHRLPREKIDELIDYSAKIFVRSEVMSRAIDISSKEFLPFARAYVEARVVPDELSFAAYCGDDLVGFVFIDDLLPPCDPEAPERTSKPEPRSKAKTVRSTGCFCGGARNDSDEDELEGGGASLGPAQVEEDRARELMDRLVESIHPKQRPLLAFMDEMKEDYINFFEREWNGGRPIKRGDVMHCAAVGVDPRYKGHNFGMGLVKEAFKNAQRRGYVAALGECTGWASQKVTERNKNEYGYVASKNYAQFEFEGKHPLANAQVPQCIATSTRFSDVNSLEGAWQDLCFFVGLYRDSLLKPHRQLMLKMYAYHSQAVKGDCGGRAPPVFRPVDRLKFNAWRRLRGMSRRNAMKNAIIILTKTIPDWRFMANLQFVGLPSDFATLGDLGVNEMMWISKTQGNKCMLCDAKFSKVKVVGQRSHNCRKCGRLVCGPCSRSRQALPDIGYDDPVRVCDNCVNTGSDVAPLGLDDDSNESTHSK